jgi:RloB-like protein
MSKGKRPRKPLSKKTEALLEQLKRRRGVRDLPKRFLIVCEDHKSAPNYFEALKKQLNLSATSIHVVGSAGHTQPVQVVRRAVELKKNAAEPESGTEPFDSVWCVIDGDYGTKINNARVRARANSVELAISTKCFEYWVLLHFEEKATPTTDCDAVVRYLRRKHFSQYAKGSCDFRDVVKNVQEASKRAERLRKPGIDQGANPEDQNPCS